MYPKIIEEFLVESFNSLFDDEVLAIEELDKELTLQSHNKIMGELALNSWLDNGEIILTEEDIITSVKKITLDSTMQSLKNMGFLNSIEDENGEELFWGTDLLNIYAESIQNATPSGKTN